MDKIFSFELWLANGQGQVSSKIRAKYPGTNSFVALLNFLQGIAREKKAVKSFNKYELYRLHVNEISQDSVGYKLGNFEVEEVRRGV